MMKTNMQLGASRATSYVNHTSGIFYHPQKYRAIRPRDAATILGLVSRLLKIKLVDLVTAINNRNRILLIL